MSAGPYAVASLLGHSSGSVLYRAVRRADGRPVILDVPVLRHARQIETLEHELEVGRVLPPSAVLTPLTLDMHEGAPVLVLDDFDGELLDARAGAAMGLDALLTLAIRITDALAQVHERGVVHRNLSPRAILVNPSTGEVRLTDLRLAALAPRGELDAHPPPRIEGSLAYISPEQTGRLNRAVTARSDLYSLGVLLYQLLTGRLPFTAHDPLEWIHAHLARTPPAPSRLGPEIPGVLSDLVLRLLAKMADDRYQSARGLQHDLEECMRRLRGGAIDPFALGARDASERLQIPHTLYGREHELATALATVERVAATGDPEVILLSGEPGVGKSALACELGRSVAAKRGFFLTGKFDQRRRDAHYAAFGEAFGDLLLDVLARPEAEVSSWRARMAEALGGAPGVLVELIPPLGMLIGEPHEPIDVAPAEIEARMHALFRRLLGVLASEGDVVLSLDDLQWADSASLALLDRVVTHPDTRHVSVVGAYRPGEIGPGHPLAQMLDDVRGRIPVQDIPLRPLSSAQVEALLADTLRRDREVVATLAELVHHKTGGNPFFVRQFLLALHRERLIELDPSAGEWRWDVRKVAARGFTDNVIDLMVRTIERLPSGTRQSLALAACVGHRVDAGTLAMIRGQSIEECHRELSDAVRDGLVTRSDETYAFVHDRVQQAAYSLIDEGDRSGVHLRIGRLLRAALDERPTGEALFDAVRHLELGAAGITSHEERLDVAELHRLAAWRARAAAAFEVALGHVEAGLALLPEDAWATHHELAFSLALGSAEGELFRGNLSEAQSILTRLQRVTASRRERAAVCRLLIDVHSKRGESAEAVVVAADCLRAYELAIEPHPTDELVAERERLLFESLGERPIESVLEQPLVRDAEIEAAIDVCLVLLPSAYFSDRWLHRLIAVHVVDLTLRHGVMPGSPMGFAALGLELAAEGRYSDAYRIGGVADALVERHGLLADRPMVELVVGVATAPFTRSLRASVAHFQRGIDAALETGNTMYACFNASWLAMATLLTGEPLERVRERAAAAFDLFRHVRYEALIPIPTCLMWLADALGERATDGSSLDDAERTGEHAPEAVPVARTLDALSRLLFSVVASDAAAGVSAAAESEALVWTIRGQVALADVFCLSTVARAAGWSMTAQARREESLAAMRGHCDWLFGLKEHCPSNFAGRWALAAAEIALVEGDELRALTCYEEAIAGARRSGLVHFEALASERCGRAHLSSGRATAGQAYVIAACDAYERWGAHAKVEQLERSYTWLRARRRSDPAALIASAERSAVSRYRRGAAGEAPWVEPPEAASMIAWRPEELDLVAVLHASQTISGEIELERLIATLLRLTLEQSGADYGVLSLAREGELWIEGIVSVENGDETPDVRRRLSKPLEGSDEAPSSVLRFAAHTKRRVILEDRDLGEGSRFASDRYLARRAPRSLLGLPILRQGVVVGVLYLENRTSSGVFTAERLATLELLAAQAAISVENAVLVERERAARENAQLLAEVSDVLGGSFEYEATLPRVGELCVRELADWCVIDVVRDGTIERLADAHGDSRDCARLNEPAERSPARWDGRSPAGVAIRTGAPVLLPEVTEADLRAMTDGEPHVAAALAVPLLARGRTLGALTLASSREDRRYGPAQLELAQEIARRAALAIDNALLYRQAQEAIRARETFLMVASHELRTPLTSLQLRLQGLAQRVAGGAPIPSEEVLGSLDVANRQSRRLASLVEQLLDVSRLAAGRLVLQPEELELHELIRGVVDELREPLDRCGSRIVIDAPAPVVGRWDRLRLGQVVENLLDNAMKFGLGRPIEIAIEATLSSASLTVRDHGIGLSEDSLSRLFGKLERAVSHRHYGGLGLGLYISRHIVEAHGGTISAQIPPGGGAAFRVELPRDTGARDEARTESGAALES